MFLPYMPDVMRCETALRELNQMWRLIESSARMHCPREAHLLLPAMVSTRTGFAHLEQALITNLVQEKVGHVLAELGTQARYAIDLLVRNLFERTADVGFLATDAELCRFAADVADATHAADAAGAAARQAMHERLAAYRDKYTVYDAILVLAPDGRVLVQAGDGAPVQRSDDPLLAATLATDTYLETFRATDLRPEQPRALVYSQRLCDPHSGLPVGVLCLCFHFEQEMAAIFAAYRDPAQRANMLLLDAHDRIISSADPLWMPAGARVPTNAAGAAQPLMFSGREYLVRTFAAEPYQGYGGPPGWKAQLMVPLELAFRTDDGGALEHADAGLVRGLLSHAQSFSPSLHALMSSVTRTTRTIARIVWNGKVTAAGTGAARHGQQGYHGINSGHGGHGGQGGHAGQDGHGNDGGDGGGQRLNTILDQIAETGARSDAVFAQSIQDLYQTVLSASISEAQLTSQLVVDMLDRNLYERANDCRWWALTPQLRAGLAAPGPAQAAAMGAVLANINRLYTVYARLVVYDRQGRIVACTGDQATLGTRMAPAVLERVCALRSPLDHHAEPFGPSALYGGRPTFVYHAAIREPGPGQAVIGGIGVVFDAAPELQAMLQAGLAGRAHMQAYFITPDQRVLAAAGSDAEAAADTMLDLPPALLAAAQAGSSGTGSTGRSIAPAGSAYAVGTGADSTGGATAIITHRGQYMIAACTRASGYREFRSVAGVEQPVLAVLLAAFGPVREAAAGAGAARLDGPGQVPTLASAGHHASASHAADRSGAGWSGHGNNNGNDSGNDMDYALFYAGATLMALRAAQVQEALPFSRVQRTAGGARSARIGMLDVAPGSHAPCVWVFDLAQLVGGRPAVVTDNSQVMLVRLGATGDQMAAGGAVIGLLVDELHSVQRFPAAALSDSPLAVGGQGTGAAAAAALAPRLIQERDSGLLIEELDLARLWARLRQ